MEARISRRPLVSLLAALLALRLCAPLGAQVLGAGYQMARSNQVDMLEPGGLALRIRFPIPMDLRYDYLLADTRRFENPCLEPAPPSCGPDTLDTATRLHSVFLAARAPLFSHGSFALFGLPEIGVAVGSITKRVAATGAEYTSYKGIMPGAGVALELSASRVAGTPIGGWIAARVRGFTHPGTVPADGYDPFHGLDWIRSVEIGLTFAMQ